MMTRVFAIIFGIAFIFAGVAGFFSTFMTNGQLFGLFEVDFMHNIIHIISGVIAIMASTSIKYSKWYFRLLGIIYATIALLGFWYSGDFYMLHMHMNFADNLLHVGIALVALYLGFFMRKKRA